MTKWGALESGEPQPPSPPDLLDDFNIHDKPHTLSPGFNYPNETLITLHNSVGLELFASGTCELQDFACEGSRC